jgi:hypothetical protein
MLVFFWKVLSPEPKVMRLSSNGNGRVRQPLSDHHLTENPFARISEMNFRSNGVRSNSVSVKWSSDQTAFDQMAFCNWLFAKRRSAKKNRWNDFWVKWTRTILESAEILNLIFLGSNKGTSLETSDLVRVTNVGSFLWFRIFKSEFVMYSRCCVTVPPLGRLSEMWQP